MLPNTEQLKTEIQDQASALAEEVKSDSKQKDCANILYQYINGNQINKNVENLFVSTFYSSLYPDLYDSFFFEDVLNSYADYVENQGNKYRLKNVKFVTLYENVYRDIDLICGFAGHIFPFDDIRYFKEKFTVINRIFNGICQPYFDLIDNLNSGKAEAFLPQSVIENLPKIRRSKDLGVIRVIEAENIDDNMLEPINELCTNYPAYSVRVLAHLLFLDRDDDAKNFASSITWTKSHVDTWDIPQILKTHYMKTRKAYLPSLRFLNDIFRIIKSANNNPEIIHFFDKSKDESVERFNRLVTNSGFVQ